MNYETYEVKVCENGDKFWFQNGERHRLDGPAIEFANGTKYWLQNGKRHRLDGPAVEWANGTKYWLQNDRYHRLDGPAVELANGTKEYWIEGKEYSYEDWKKKVEELNNPIKEMTVGELSKLLGYNVKIVKE